MDASTPLNEEEQKGLKPNLATRRELDDWEYRNVLEARVWATDSRQLKRYDPLTESYIRKLHEQMFNQTWKWAGTYRSSEKANIRVPFHQIRNLVPALLGDVRYWVDHHTFDIDEIAIRFHHRLVWIHPFPNGNGRHARLLADVIAIKFGRDAFTWGPKELVDEGPARTEYIRCLKLADANNDDIQPLMKFARS
jgi:Fic-DOC domain mobile mystery protein B